MSVTRWPSASTMFAGWLNRPAWLNANCIIFQNQITSKHNCFMNESILWCPDMLLLCEDQSNRLTCFKQGIRSNAFYVHIQYIHDIKWYIVEKTRELRWVVGTDCRGPAVCCLVLSLNIWQGVMTCLSAGGRSDRRVDNMTYHRHDTKPNVGLRDVHNYLFNR